MTIVHLMFKYKELRSSLIEEDPTCQTLLIR